MITGEEVEKMEAMASYCMDMARAVSNMNKPESDNTWGRIATMLRTLLSEREMIARAAIEVAADVAPPIEGYQAKNAYNEGWLAARERYINSIRALSPADILRQIETPNTN